MKQTQYDLLKTTLTYIKLLIEEIEENYDVYKVEFLKGDIVYYINYNGDVIKATIDKVEGYYGYGQQDPNKLVYYWIIPENAKLSWYHNLRFWIACKIKRWYPQPPKEFPGHSVLAGEDFFRTKDEAEKFITLSYIYNELENYLSKCE